MYRKLGDGEPANPINEMIAQHWKYVESVLIAHGVQGRELSASGHHYRTAFAHGWKHAKEDNGEAICTLRGEYEANRFANSIIHTLNLPKNKIKGPWAELSATELVRLLKAEVEELHAAIFDGNGNAAAEAADVGAFAMMLHDRFKE